MDNPTMKKSSLTALAAVLALGVAGQAFAQTAPIASGPKPAAPAAAAQPAPPTPPTFGAAVPGMCVLDESTAMSSSAMGKAAADRLGQLKGQVDAELSAQGQALETEKKTLQTSQPTGAAVTPAQKDAWQKKVGAWQQKAEAFQGKVQQRNQEMQYTQQQVMQVIFQKMIPSINSVVTSKACSGVVSADSLVHYEMNGANDSQSSFVYANPSMNITTSVVEKMNASGEVLPPFERVNLDQAAAAQK